jgi:hypothetical protein
MLGMELSAQLRIQHLQISLLPSASFEPFLNQRWSLRKSKHWPSETRQTMVFPKCSASGEAREAHLRPYPECRAGEPRSPGYLVEDHLESANRTKRNLSESNHAHSWKAAIEAKDSKGGTEQLPITLLSYQETSGDKTRCLPRCTASTLCKERINRHRRDQKGIDSALTHCSDNVPLSASSHCQAGSNHSMHKLTLLLRTWLFCSKTSATS